MHEQETQVGDLPEVCLAQVIALTSPRDASRCAAVSPAFRAAADSDDVWCTFLPSRPELDRLLLLPPPKPKPPAVAAKSSSKTDDGSKKKDAYLGLCDTGALLDADDGDGGRGCVRVWLEKSTGARCYALSARRLSLPWDDGEFSWRWTTPHHPLSTRFAEVAELVDCTCLDIYGRLPAAALTPGIFYAAYLVYSTAPEGGHRGLSFPDQETTVAMGGRVVARHAVCLRPDDAAARKFRAVAAGSAELAPPPRQPRRREDGWWEMDMGRVTCGGDEKEGEEVVACFEVLGWYPKRGLIIEAMEFRPLR